MDSPILGSSYVARSVNVADNRMVNMYPEAVQEGGMTAGFLSRAPGLRRLVEIGEGPIRGLWVLKDYLYVVSGSAFYQTSLYSTTTAWRLTQLGTVTGTGPVSMSDNGTQIFIACNPDGYIYNSTTNVFA